MIENSTEMKLDHTYLSGVDLALDDVEDGDVAVLDLLVDRGGDHHVLGLQQPAHKVVNFTRTGQLFVLRSTS